MPDFFVPFRGFLLIPFLLFSAFCFAQAGCTDSTATNFDPHAKVNDGSCIYAGIHCTAALKTALSQVLSESSGLVFTDGKLWSHNDNGNAACIYNIDTASGRILQTVYVDNYANGDWEDITADSNYIYIGDCGNNNGDRRDLKVLRVKKSDIGGGATVHVKAEAIAFAYADQKSYTSNGSSTNFDCEAITVFGNSIYLFTKDHGDLQTRVYRLPKTPGSYVLSPYTSFNTMGMITGADFDPIKREIALIGYFKGHTSSFMWILNDFKADSFFTGNKRRIDLGDGTEWQTEGICYANKSRFFISCETAGNYNASLFAIDEDAWLKKRNSLKELNSNTSLQVYPNPACSYVHFENNEPILSLSIENMMGRSIYEEVPNTSELSVDLGSIPHLPGVYIVRLRTASRQYMVKLMLY